MMISDPMRVVEFGAYEENEVLVAGWRLTDESISEVILQDNRTRVLDAPGTQGPHLEVDGHGAYYSVEGFEYDDSRSVARLLLKHPVTPVRSLDLPVPPSATPKEREVLCQLASSVGAFLRG